MSTIISGGSEYEGNGIYDDCEQDGSDGEGKYGMVHIPRDNSADSQRGINQDIDEFVEFEKVDGVQKIVDDSFLDKSINGMYHKETRWFNAVHRRFTPTTLSDAEELKLSEIRIERALRGGLVMGLEVLHISINGLYRSEYKTLNSYMKKRWDMSKSRYYQLLEAARIYTNLAAYLDANILPDRVSPLLALRKVTPTRDMTIREAIKYYLLAMEKMLDGKKPTAAKIREIIDEDPDVIKEQEEKKNNRNKITQFNKSDFGKHLKSLVERIDKLSEQILSIYTDCDDESGDEYLVAIESIDSVKKCCDEFIEKIKSQSDFYNETDFKMFPTRDWDGNVRNLLDLPYEDIPIDDDEEEEGDYDDPEA